MGDGFLAGRFPVDHQSYAEVGLEELRQTWLENHYVEVVFLFLLAVAEGNRLADEASVGHGQRSADEDLEGASCSHSGPSARHSRIAAHHVHVVVAAQGLLLNYPEAVVLVQHAVDLVGVAAAALPRSRLSIRCIRSRHAVAAGAAAAGEAHGYHA